jgi:hypothetical protein
MYLKKVLLIFVSDREYRGKRYLTFGQNHNNELVDDINY